MSKPVEGGATDGGAREPSELAARCAQVEEELRKREESYRDMRRLYTERDTQYAAAESEVTKLREQLKELSICGSRMANVMFNLKQNADQSQGNRCIFEQLQIEWDTAKLSASELLTPSREADND